MTIVTMYCPLELPIRAMFFAIGMGQMTVRAVPCYGNEA